MARLILTLLIVLIGFLSSCAGYPRLLNSAVDPGGGGLNSAFAEINPQVTSHYVVFASDRQGKQDIYLYDTTTQQLVDLPGLNALDAIADEPTISENGRYIAFTTTRSGQSDIYLYNRETRQLRNLTQNLNAVVRNPTMSADGRLIAFESSLNGQWDILVYDIYGQPLNLPVSPR